MSSMYFPSFATLPAFVVADGESSSTGKTFEVVGSSFDSSAASPMVASSNRDSAMFAASPAFACSNVNAPVIAASPVSHGGDSGGKNKGLARALGGATSGLLELILFHPVDTISKRLMSNQGKIVIPGDRAATIVNMNQVVFRHAANEGALAKYKSMFPGVGFAAGYKVAQRTYKFGGQPFVMDFINGSVGKPLQDTLGPKKGKVMSSALAGSIMGVGEVLLLPLDVLKIKAQTNPEVLKGRGLVDIFAKEGRNLYKGGAWTAARNAPGSFALFGGASAVQYGIFKLEDPKKATFWQNFCASVGGAVASITVAAPLDVVKTRIQNKSFESTETGTQVIRNLIKNEGFGAFFKGLTPKIIIVGPKLVFSFTVAQSVMNYLGQVLG